MKMFPSLAASMAPALWLSADVHGKAAQPSLLQAELPVPAGQQESPPISKYGISVPASRWIVCAGVGALQSSFHVQVNRSTAHSSKSSFNSHHYQVSNVELILSSSDNSGSSTQEGPREFKPVPVQWGSHSPSAGQLESAQLPWPWGRASALPCSSPTHIPGSEHC